MKRRTFVKQLGLVGGGVMLSPVDMIFPGGATLAALSPQDIIGRLQKEPPCHSEVRTERGTPRLFINGEETAPFFGLSTSMAGTVENFRQMGVHMLFPIIGTRSFWPGPGQYEWKPLEDFLARLVTAHPETKLFLRLHLHTPAWWTEAHPEECIEYALPTPEGRYDLGLRGKLIPIDGGHNMRSGRELREASFASEIWRRDTADMLKSLVRYIEKSPLRSRVMGFFLMNGASGEWNIFGSDYLPDYSAPMQKAAGPVPTARERLNTTYGLLRDPAVEGKVIEFYRQYHREGPKTVAYLAKAIKETVARPLICGAFHGYLMEVPRIQDSGFLSPQPILDSPDIDLLAGPYGYQNTNDENKKSWESDMYDGAGNWLGRCRGVAGDSAFRLMVESLRRRGKLYSNELDPNTHLDVKDGWRGIGGSGSKTVEGSVKIMQRDVGKVYAEGVAGWFYDFGPVHGVPTGWFGDPALIEAVKPILKLMDQRHQLDLTPVAETALLADTDSFFATQHWLAAKPWKGQGIGYTDLINHWFLNSQNRSLQRLGAPVDYLYRTDLTAADARRYRLLLIPNSFLMSEDEVARLHAALRGSETTVVWYYAPGLLRPDEISLQQMEHLTGFQFEEQLAPGPLLINTVDDGEGLPGAFGVKSDNYYSPRFTVSESGVDVLGHWQDIPSGVAFARRVMDGWTSVYVGTAPLPVEWLRSLATGAGVTLWSTQPDVVGGTQSTAMLVATSDGPRRLTLPYAMVPAEGGPASREHDLELTMGDVKLFHAPV